MSHIIIETEEGARGEVSDSTAKSVLEQILSEYEYLDVTTPEEAHEFVGKIGQYILSRVREIS